MRRSCSVLGACAFPNCDCQIQPESETPETDAALIDGRHIGKLVILCRSLERRLSLAQTEIKGHMRVEDDLSKEDARLRALLDDEFQRRHNLGTQLEQAQSRIAELEKDAARYRWLRDTDSEWGTLFAEPIKWEGGGWVKLGSRWVREYLDAVIDAALKDRA
jgi:hypothetical protein